MCWGDHSGSNFAILVFQNLQKPSLSVSIKRLQMLSKLLAKNHLIIFHLISRDNYPYANMIPLYMWHSPPPLYFTPKDSSPNWVQQFNPHFCLRGSEDKLHGFIFSFQHILCTYVGLGYLFTMVNIKNVEDDVKSIKVVLLVSRFIFVCCVNVFANDSYTLSSSVNLQGLMPWSSASSFKLYFLYASVYIFSLCEWPVGNLDTPTLRLIAPLLDSFKLG